MSLKEYTRKRDFSRSAEPGPARPRTQSDHHFVIQKHAASRLHYDFRLEMDGVLKSWAVPKGIPFTKGEKRLAVQVEDHPVSYMKFEGTIPKGQYGGGTVMVWDYGDYKPTSPAWKAEFAKGKLHFELHGKKLKGEWYLVRLRGGDQWLLIRGKDNMRPVSAKLDDTSSLSGRTMKQLAATGDEWQSNRAVKKPRVPNRKKVTQTSSGHGTHSSLPHKNGKVHKLTFIEPMKARLANSVPPGDWLYEIKFDGFRAIALKQSEEVRLLSRNEKDFNKKFPEVVAACRELEASEAVVDGEVVALDSKGRSSFQLLQAHDLGERPPIFYYAFDLLQLNGKNLMHEPLTQRKARLEELLKTSSGVIRYSASLKGKPQNLLKQARKLGLEGLIAKRSDSLYEPGARSGAWIKLKLHQEQEMVIGGFTDPEGTRKRFGALLVGYYQGKQLRFAGKVGTGFNEALLRELHKRFVKLRRDDPPFANLPEKKAGRFGSGLTSLAMKQCHWIEPTLVGQIKFSEWTNENKLRQPVFLGLREDKNPREVVREVAT